MHFFVAGATGRPGTAFVTAASAAGHSVTAFVRNPAKAASLPATLVEGDVLDRASIERALTSEHVIVSTLGGGSPMAPGTSVGIGTANLVAAATERGAKRILAVVGAGVLQADPQ